MDRNIIRPIAAVLLSMVCACRATECTRVCEPPAAADKTAPPQQAEPNGVDVILKQLNSKILELKSYEGRLEYKFIQPLLESEAIRKGTLYYLKLGKTSKLRINFQTLKQEDEKEQKYLEHYIFDGTWLTQINYEVKAVRKYQVTEPNKPIDAFEAASRNLPLIGFTKIENLKRQFEIKLVEGKNRKPTDPIRLHLEVKPDSTYKDDYVSLDFWIDRKLGLPTKVAAVSTEEDIYEIKFLKPKINRPISGKVFEFKIPKDFGEPEIIPLKKKDAQDD